MGPSKDWMAFWKDRLNEKYKAGVQEFLDYAFESTSIPNKIRCPCMKCCNTFSATREVVEMHLFVHGILPAYTVWYHHVEMPKDKKTKRHGKLIPPGMLAKERGSKSKAFQKVGESTNLVADNQKHGSIIHKTSGCCLVLHYHEEVHIKKDFDEDCCFMDILRLCKRSFDIYSVRFRIVDDDELPLVDDNDILWMIKQHGGVGEIHVHVEEDTTASLLSFKLPEDIPSLASSIPTSSPPKVTNLKIVGDVKVNEKVVVVGDVIGGSEEASTIQMFISISKNFGVDDNLTSISPSQNEKVFLIPLQAVNHYLVAKYTPITEDGKFGRSGYVISDTYVENSAPEKKKSVRGPNLNKKVAALKSGQKIDIKFYNKRGVGDNHSSWSRHLGKIVRDIRICPLRADTWHKIAIEAKNHMWGAVKESFQHDNMEIYRQATLEHMGTLWTSWRTSLYNTYVDPCKTKAEALKNCPSEINVDDWTWLVNEKWFTKKFQEKRKQSIKNKRNSVMHHKTGSKPHRAIMYDMGGKDGNPPDFLDLFFETRQKGGTLQDEATTKKYDEIAKTIQSDPSLSTLEVIEKCFGPQTHSHVFGYGGGVKRKDVTGSKSTYEQELEAELRKKEEENTDLQKRMVEMEEWKKDISKQLEAFTKGSAQQSSITSPSANTNHLEVS